MRNKRWIVYTPSYEQHQGSWYGDPPQYGADVVEIEAKTRRDAVIMGTRVMLDMGYDWVHDNRSDGRAPFCGVRARTAREWFEAPND